MRSELSNLNLKLGSNQNNKIDFMHLIVAPQLSGDWQHNYSTKASQAGSTNDQSIYSFMHLVDPIRSLFYMLDHLIVNISPQSHLSNGNGDAWGCFLSLDSFFYFISEEFNEKKNKINQF